MNTEHTRQVYLTKQDECYWGTILTYEGSKQGLLAAGIAQPSWFRVGKAGTKSIPPRIGQRDRYMIKRLSNRWRIEIRRSNYRLAALGVWITHQEVWDGIEETTYEGTKKALYESGIARPYMLRVPPSGTRSLTNRNTPVDRWFMTLRGRGGWRLTLYREIDKGTPKEVADKHNTDNVIPFPGVQL